LNVAPGDLVYVPPTQSNEGFYVVQSVDSDTSLTVATAFPLAGSISFKVVTSFGATEQSLNDLIDIRAAALTFYNNSVLWTSLASTAVPVLVPPGTADSTYFARGYTSSDFTSRTTDINARKTQVASDIDKITSILSSSDRFYDKRYVWIDARINLEKGILIKQKRAVANRIKAQAETLKQLTKLLAVEG
jgi:hypothetical protein